jgi:hypothetical protein
VLDHAGHDTVKYSQVPGCRIRALITAGAPHSLRIETVLCPTSPFGTVCTIHPACLWDGARSDDKRCKQRAGRIAAQLRIPGADRRILGGHTTSQQNQQKGGRNFLNADSANQQSQQKGGRNFLNADSANQQSQQKGFRCFCWSRISAF